MHLPCKVIGFSSGHGSSPSALARLLLCAPTRDRTYESDHRRYQEYRMMGREMCCRIAWPCRTRLNRSADHVLTRFPPCLSRASDRSGHRSSGRLRVDTGSRDQSAETKSGVANHPNPNRETYIGLIVKILSVLSESFTLHTHGFQLAHDAFDARHIVACHLPNKNSCNLAHLSPWLSPLAAGSSKMAPHSKQHASHL